MKLIVTDLDGTLFQPNETISDKDLLWIRKAEDAGIKVIVATGRQYGQALAILGKSNFKPDYIITDNGACTYSVKDNKKIASFPLKREKVKEILEYLEESNYNYSVTTETDRVQLWDVKEKLTHEYNLNLKENPNLDKYHLDSLVELILDESRDTHFAENKEDILSIDSNFYNVTAISFSPTRIKEGIHGGRKINGVNVVSSAYNNFEFQSSEVSKGNALAALADYLNISLKDTMALGDNFNDQTMLETAYHSVAMGNAHDDIKKICRYTTLKNTENGVAHAIKTFALL